MTSEPSRVLLVEDDWALRRIIQLNLAARGYQVDVAASGAAALELTQQHPDIIVVDLGLPDMDGIDLITHIRRFSATPILVASARDAHDWRPAALGAGADRYLAKPFAIDQLIGALRDILARQEPPLGHPLRLPA